MFFSDWATLARILVVGVITYVVLVALLRVYGKRTLAQFNAFDFIVTVALGSTLATILLSREVALTDGIVALLLLMSLQYAITFLTTRLGIARRLAKSRPRLLYRDGTFLDAALLDERVTHDEVCSAVRQQGIASMQDVEAVVLETSGSMTAVRKSTGPPTALEGVRGYDA